MYLGYAAGFFDGEGCVSIHNYNLVVRINQVRREVLDELTKAYGGSVISMSPPRKSTHRQCYAWSLYGQKAYEFLKKLLPFLIVKENEVAYAIQFWEAEDRTKTWRDHREKLKELKKEIN